MNNPDLPPDVLQFNCSACQTLLKVPASSAGPSGVKCPKCEHVSHPEKQAAPDPVVQPSEPLLSEPEPPQPQATAPVELVTPTVVESVAPVVTGASAAQQSLPKSPVHEGRDTEVRRLYQKLTAEVGKLFVGQEELVQGTLVALFSGGHVLIESVPGLGKTLFVRTLGKALGCQFGRIQFTADLMPSDVTGAPIFNMKTQEFVFKPGPIFTQLLLADEINRAPAKTHAALLEIMQESNVTIDGKTHELAPPFLVMATQNPIESEGTYNLPEAQLDRFMFKLVADYPNEQQEAAILGLHSGQSDLDRRLESEIETIATPAEINRVIAENSNVRVDPLLVNYINKMVRLTRAWPQFHFGASPRAGISLMQGARTLAAFSGRDYAVPDEVVSIAKPTLRHRVMLTAEAEVEGQSVDQLLDDLIRSIEVPRIKA